MHVTYKGFETMLMNPSHHHVQHRCVHLQGQTAAANVSHTRVCASKCGFLLIERLVAGGLVVTEPLINIQSIIT